MRQVGYIGLAIILVALLVQHQATIAKGFIDIWVDDVHVAQRAGINIQGLNGITATSTDSAANNRVDVGLDGSAFPTSAFTTMAVPTGTNPVADSTSDTLTFAEFPGIDIFGTSTSDTLNFAFDLSEVDLTNAIALGTDTTGDYVQSITEGTAIDVTGGTGEGSTPSIAFDSTELGTTTWGSGSSITWTYDTAGTDPTLAFTSATLTTNSNVVTSGTNGTYSCSAAADCRLYSASNQDLELGDGTSILYIDGAKNGGTGSVGIHADPSASSVDTDFTIQPTQRTISNNASFYSMWFAANGTFTEQGTHALIATARLSGIQTQGAGGSVTEAEILRLDSPPDDAAHNWSLTIASGNANIGAGNASPNSTSTLVWVFGDGTAPVVMGANTAGLYADDVSGTVEMFGIDEAGNKVQLTNHPAEFLAQVALACAYPFAEHSSNAYLGVEIFVDWCGLILTLEALTGEQFLYVHTIEKRDWYADQQAKMSQRADDRQVAISTYNDLNARYFASLGVDSPEVTERIKRERDSVAIPSPYAIKHPPRYLRLRIPELMAEYCLRVPGDADCRGKP